MEAQDLTPEEQEILKRFRSLSEAQKEAVTATEHSFRKFLESIQEVWKKVSGYVKEIWNLFKSVFQ